jgi:hypothetical protein
LVSNASYLCRDKINTKKDILKEEGYNKRRRVQVTKESWENILYWQPEQLCLIYPAAYTNFGLAAN